MMFLVKPDNTRILRRRQNQTLKCGFLENPDNLTILVDNFLIIRALLQQIDKPKTTLTQPAESTVLPSENAPISISVPPTTPEVIGTPSPQVQLKTCRSCKDYSTDKSQQSSREHLAQLTSILTRNYIPIVGSVDKYVIDSN
ncbi:hypothetical protein FQA39_LY09211 [Lamprigera yunnana]|nr:hypothetical protein FQA39_LY09211 [Lamprigera yunnana]